MLIEFIVGNKGDGEDFTEGTATKLPIGTKKLGGLVMRRSFEKLFEQIISLVVPQKWIEWNKENNEKKTITIKNL